MQRAELDRIYAQSAAHGIDWLFMVAIRCAENGTKDEFHGAPYGVLPDPHDPNKSLQVACATIRNMLIRAQADHQVFVPSQCGAYVRACYSEGLLGAVAAHWAPIGAANDPNNKNANWQNNVRSFYRQLCKADVGWLIEGGS